MSLFQQPAAPAARLAIAGLAFTVLLAQPLSPESAGSAEAPHPAPAAAGIPVYAAADDSALQIGILAAGEKVMPLAETQSGGIKWYLVKTKSGVVGWIRHNDNEQSKKAEHFFRSLPTEPAGIAVEIQSSSAGAARRGAVIIPVKVNGRSVIVPVTFNHSLNANLLLDTGASMTMISRRLAANLALPSTGAGLFSGIGGTVSAQIARVDSIRVGDAEVSGMTVSIHDVSRFPQFDGLLGMDFLGRFQVSVDAAKKLLVLTGR